MTALLARSADHIFWMARYVERAENLARILDVQETFSRDERGHANWLPIVHLNADSEPFFARYPVATGGAVAHFYILDDQNPNSIVSVVRFARDNARTLRPLISTEMWTQLNVFFNEVRALGAVDVVQPELPRICAFIKEQCQTHTGITEGTFFRDQSWYFYQLGRHIERADQMTRLLDIKYHLLLPSPRDVGSPLDVGQWNSLLRSAAGYHAFRRVQPRGMSPSSVAGFLLLNDAFPRSVRLCVHEIDQILHILRGRYGLRGGVAAMERIDELRASLQSTSIEVILGRGLHEYLDWVQVMLSQVTMDIGVDFFGYERPAAAAASQSQSQSGA